jgi:hypothetical protein
MITQEILDEIVDAEVDACRGLGYFDKTCQSANPRRPMTLARGTWHNGIHINAQYEAPYERWLNET